MTKSFGLWLRALSICSIGLCWAAASLAQERASAMRAVDITDASGFQQPVVVAIIEIPAGWQPRGGVQWNRSTNCVSNQLRVEWLAAPPDGSQAFELMHGYQWQVQGTQMQMKPCPVQAFDSARAFLTAVVQQRRPGKRVLQHSGGGPSSNNDPYYNPAGSRELERVR